MRYASMCDASEVKEAPRLLRGIFGKLWVQVHEQIEFLKFSSRTYSHRFTKKEGGK